MELAEKVFKTQNYNYAKTFLDLVIKSFEEKQIKRDAENAKLAVLDNTEANARKQVLQEVLVHLYECRDDLTRESIIDNQTSAIIAFGFGENGLELQDAYFDVTGNVQFDEKILPTNCAKSLLIKSAKRLKKIDKIKSCYK